MRHARRAPGPTSVLAPVPVLLLAAGLAVSCTGMRLASRAALPAGEPVPGPAAGYWLVPPSGDWVRADWIEADEKIDLALAHESADAWLNVSVLPERFATAEAGLVAARSQVDALMATVFRDERDAVVRAPEGELAARRGVYCGTFDREMRSRDNCFVLLSVLRGRTSYVLVGQVRLRDGEDDPRMSELEQLVDSFELGDRADGDAAPGDGASGDGGR